MKRILFLIAASFVFITSYAQSDYNQRKAEGYMREAEYYKRGLKGIARKPIIISTKQPDMKRRLHTT